MKFCKNCGHESEDGKIRCSYCGYLFEDEMDNVLHEINASLGNYKNELAAVQTQPLAPIEPVANVQQASTAKETEELKLEVANLKGQISAMQGELFRINQRGGVVAQPPSQVIYHTPTQPNTYAYPAPGVYTQSVEQSSGVTDSGKKVKTKKVRKKSRIVLSLIALLLLAASIASFFFVWISYEGFDGFKGIDAIKNLFGLGGENFATFCDKIANHSFPGPAFIPTVCKYICLYGAKFGIIVYAALLVLGFPLLFSLGGRVCFKGWHSFFAWTSAILSLILFGIFIWVTGFSAISIIFLGGAAANILRGFFLLFYRR